MAGSGLDVDSVIERLLSVRGQPNNRTVQLAEGEIRALCATARCVTVPRSLRTCVQIARLFFSSPRARPKLGFDWAGPSDAARRASRCRARDGHRPRACHARRACESHRSRRRELRTPARRRFPASRLNRGVGTVKTHPRTASCARSDRPNVRDVLAALPRVSPTAETPRTLAAPDARPPRLEPALRSRLGALARFKKAPRPVREDSFPPLSAAHRI